MSDASFDAVVIGSGLGGLTAAALLAKAGRKVCVIERNHSLGGAASAFKHGALTIEPALHQTADPRDPREPKHAILKQLGLLDEIEWIPVSPFFSVRGGPVGDTFDLPVGFEGARRAMARRFPNSRRGIDRLFALIETLHAGVSDLDQARVERSVGRLLRGAVELRSLIGDWRASLDDVLARTLGDDEAAKLCLAGNLGYYADDPRRMWWPYFALAQGGFLSVGGVFIKGGSRTLSMKLARVVLKAGGSVLLGREAVGVELDAAGRPALVRHADTKTRKTIEHVGAKCVFANCAPDVLAGLLRPAAARRGRARLWRARTFDIAIHGAFRRQRAAGEVRSRSLRNDRAAGMADIASRQRRIRAIARGRSRRPRRLPSYGIANYGAIDSGLSDGGPTLVSVVELDRLSNWAALSPQDEKDRRERWLDAFQAALERDYPGLGAAVSVRMFLNARSMRNFLNTPDGAVYGFAPLPPRRGIWAGIPRSPRTPVPGLYLASSFGGSGGFTGAMRSGAEAARLAMAERAA